MKTGWLATLLVATGGVAQGILPFPYHIDNYDNGLRLITIETDYPDVVSVHIVVATGSRNEVEAGKSGFAHFFEHMMFRGTENFTSEQQAAVFKEAGADRNAYTTNDYTNYHTTVTKSDLETVLKLEADRFRYLSYTEKAFRTEAMAVLGEYNKNSANPVSKAFEVLQDTAFDAHTYKHTTIGFLRDIRMMPRQYEYSKEFFERWYKPEYTTVVVVGDIERAETKRLVDRYWGDWERGSYTVEIPVEPPQTGPRSAHIKWPAETQPWVFVAFKGPRFEPDSRAMPALDVMSAMAFSPSSDLYRELYVQDRKVDQLWSYFPDSKDPYLLIIAARLRDAADWAHVRDRILQTCEGLKSGAVDAARLAAVKSNLRYSFASGLDSSEAIASALAGYIGRTRTPAAVESVYEGYQSVTGDDIRAVAREYFVENARTIATLSHEALPDAAEPVTAVAKQDEGATDDSGAVKATAAALPDAVLLPTGSPLVTFRLQLAAGAADDPAGKEGLAYVTAQLVSDGGTVARTYSEVVDAFYPLAAGLSARVDKQMTTFFGTVHRDQLAAYYALFREVMQEPRFDPADFERVRSDALTAIKTGLRRTNDEELGKEVLYAQVYAGHPFGHPNLGTIKGLESLTLEDVQTFYREHYHGDLLTLGLAGGYPDGFERQVHRDFFGASPEDKEAVSASADKAIPDAPAIKANRMTIVEKQALATGLHIGFPIEVTRDHPDWPALWLVRSYFGEHRSENSYLYQRLREIRGLNYGDYAYIEYFPNGGGQFHPPANVARSEQIFQIWIRPVPHQNGPFTLKAAWYELDKLVREGMTQESFEATRNYLSKFVALLVKTDDRRLGYALDSRFYGTDDFVTHVREGLAKLTLDDVNRVIREHLRSDNLQFVVITEDAESFRTQILGTDPTPITYQTKPDASILEEDAHIERIHLNLSEPNTTITPINEVFVTR